MPGRVKTRLIPALGAEGAAALARQMLESTFAAAITADIGPVELCADPAPEDPAWAGLIPPGVETFPQGEGDLGARLSRASARTVSHGERVLLIGADCPALDAARLRAAAAALDEHDACILPAEDGGYVLLGLTRHDPGLFENIGWSGPDVARGTIARLAALGWRTWVGETLRDVDEPADLA